MSASQDEFQSLADELVTTRARLADVDAQLNERLEKWVLVEARLAEAVGLLGEASKHVPRYAEFETATRLNEKIAAFLARERAAQDAAAAKALLRGGGRGASDAEMSRVLEMVQWSGAPTSYSQQMMATCPSCNRGKDFGHASDCALAAAIAHAAESASAPVPKDDALGDERRAELLRQLAFREKAQMTFLVHDDQDANMSYGELRALLGGAELEEATKAWIKWGYARERAEEAERRMATLEAAARRLLDAMGVARASLISDPDEAEAAAYGEWGEAEDALRELLKG